MSTRLNDFTRFLNDHGARALDQLAAGRAAAGMAAGAEGVPVDASPLDRLAAQWSLLDSGRESEGPQTSRDARRRRRPGPPEASTARANRCRPARGPDASNAREVKRADEPASEKKAKKKAKKALKKARKEEKKAKKQEEKARKKKAKKEEKARAKGDKKPGGKAGATKPKPSKPKEPKTGA